MRILVTNDDGIFSPALRVLATCAKEFGEVRIVAPDVEQSSRGHAITASRPLSIKKTPVDGFTAYRVDGTPADCVALGTHQWGEVDLVLSGINLGLNLGNSAWHSGTLAAAKQGTLLGMRGVAVSAPAPDEGDLDHLIPHVTAMLEAVIPHERLTLVNVNLPSEPRGFRWTKQSVRHYDGEIRVGTDPMGREHYWFTVSPIEEVEEGTDRWAVQRGFVSLTPLDLDITDHDELAWAEENCPVE